MDKVYEKPYVKSCGLGLSKHVPNWHNVGDEDLDPDDVLDAAIKFMGAYALDPSLIESLCEGGEGPITTSMRVSSGASCLCIIGNFYHLSGVFHIEDPTEQQRNKMRAAWDIHKKSRMFRAAKLMNRIHARLAQCRHEIERKAANAWAGQQEASRHYERYRSIFESLGVIVSENEHLVDWRKLA